MASLMDKASCVNALPDWWGKGNLNLFTSRVLLVSLSAYTPHVNIFPDFLDAKNAGFLSLDVPMPLKSETCHREAH